MTTKQTVRLTSLARCGGCAAKFGPGELYEVIAGLPQVDDPNVLVGIATGDDAGVYRINDEVALVQTVDFFPPVVDDPFTYGAVAAANALSDIYATGARPITALNIVAFPKDLPREILKAILTGGAAKAAEAGVPIIGGHTIDDAEPKYGMAVTGVVHPGKQLTNDAARPGDLMVLTKPIGAGLITTAAKADLAPPSALDEAVHYMTALNRAACEAAVEVGVNGCTDITGFGLLGHVRGVAQASRVRAIVRMGDVPLMQSVWELAVEQNTVPSGTLRNRSYLDPSVTWDPAVHPEAWKILMDPQTSGGLLLTLPPERAPLLLASLKSKGVATAAVIGRIDEGPAGAIHVTG